MMYLNTMQILKREAEPEELHNAILQMDFSREGRQLIFAGKGKGEAEALPLKEGTIFRAGGKNPGNISEPNLSFRDSLSNPIDSASNPVFKPGKEWFSTDVSKFARRCSGA